MEKKYQKIKKIVEEELVDADVSHDTNHIMRTYQLALKLAKGEKGIDLDILKMAVLLHDICRAKEDKDTTGKICHAKLSAERAEEILKKLRYPQEKIDKIVHCILAHRYRTGIKPKTKEAKILSDADKLDVIGAIGIAKTFIIAGWHNQNVFKDVDLKRYRQENIESNRIRDVAKHSPFIEYEMKFKDIPRKIYTPKAKKMAKDRLAYMRSFFNRIKKEIKGDI